MDAVAVRHEAKVLAEHGRASMARGDEHAKRTSLGKALGRMRDRIYTINGRRLRIHHAGSAHGARKGGLTDTGRELLSRLESAGIVLDLAHASSATIDDVLTLAARPVVASHTGIHAVAPGIRNLPDDHVRGIAATGGLVGIGFWPVATGGTDVAAIARSIGAAIGLAGAEHVAIGSDFDGAVTSPFDAGGLPLLTDALLAEGLSDDDIAAVMGRNALRLLASSMPG